MPSVVQSAPLSLESQIDKKKDKKMKKQSTVDSLTNTEETSNRKQKKHKSSSYSPEMNASNNDFELKTKDKKKEKEKKKRKAVELGNDDGSERSETSSELVEPVIPRAKKEKLMMERSSDEEDAKIVEEENPNAVSNFRISKLLRDELKSKGIESLFPIQAMTFDTILDGSDLVGRARTGQV